MIEVGVDLSDVTEEDVASWPDEPYVGDLLMALAAYAGEMVTVRIVQYHKSPGPNWGHEEPEHSSKKASEQ